MYSAWAPDGKSVVYLDSLPRNRVVVEYGEYDDESVSRRPWSVSDDNLLRKLLNEGESGKAIARRMGRTVAAVQQRWHMIKKTETAVVPSAAGGVERNSAYPTDSSSPNKSLTPPNCGEGLTALPNFFRGF